MPAVHDLAEIRREVFARVGHLCRCIRRMKAYHHLISNSSSTLTEDRRHEAGEKLKRWSTNWGNTLLSVFPGLKYAIPPRVREYLWDLPEFNRLDSIPFRVVGRDDQERAKAVFDQWIQKGNDPKDWRLAASSHRELCAMIEDPLLKPDWPDEPLAKCALQNLFEQCKVMADTQPEEFRLTPITTNEAAEGVKSILMEFDTPHRMRLEADMDLSSEMDVRKLRMMDKLGELRPAQYLEPDRGCRYERLEKRLRRRWPRINPELIASGILEAFRRGWLAANGGPCAREAGYTSRVDGEIENDTQLDRWLRSRQVDRFRFTMVFAPPPKRRFQSEITENNPKQEPESRSTTRRGRKAITWGKREDRIVTAWGDGSDHRTYADLARQLGGDYSAGEIRKVLDRHRKNRLRDQRQDS